MTLNDYFLFIFIVTLVVVSPGVNLFLLLQATPSQGRSAGLLITLGFCVAILIHASLALVGLGALILASTALFSLVKLAGAAYLIWLGVKALGNAFKSAPLKVPSTSERPTPRTGKAQLVLKGLLTNLLNPKPAIFYVAAFPQFLDAQSADAYWLGGLGMGVSHALVALIFYSVVVVALDKVARWLCKPPVWTWIQSVSGVVFFLIGGRLLLARAPS
ncbi:LysE family translocator [Vreelandella sp. EE7]